MSLLAPEAMRAELSVPVVIVGAGACGLVAALACAGAGAVPLVLERDHAPSGSTALSSGFIPAAGTAFQRQAGIEDDTPGAFAADILAKTKQRADAVAVRRVADAIGPTLEWLAAAHSVPFEVLQGFRYPGHGALRMHAVPERTGAALLARLLGAVEAAGIPVSRAARVVGLFADADGRIGGVRLIRPDGSFEDVGCAATILACSGFGGAPSLLRRHIPEMAQALYFGHVGNQGDALGWGEALGADLRDLGAYQGHGSVATPHGALVTWALMMEGGIQVNAEGLRFWNEHEGYSEAALAVLRQPGGIAFDVYDARLRALARSFPDYLEAERAGAVRQGSDVAELAAATGLPLPALTETLAEVQRLAESGGIDGFGRAFAGKPLVPPYFAVKVTGALFHTQGGLVVDGDARVLRRDGSALPNLFAGGGAARGVSGPGVSGYLSGNGLLTAVAYGALAGRAAALLTKKGPADRPLSIDLR